VKPYFREGESTGYVGQGIEVAVVRHQYDVNKSAVFFINKNGDQTRENVKSSSPLSMNISCLSCDPFLRKIEGHCVYGWKCILVSARKVPGEEFPGWEEADIQLVLDYQLCEADLEQLTVLSVL
jgi:hypothetical protein